MHKTYDDVQDRYDSSTVLMANIFFLLKNVITVIIVTWFNSLRPSDAYMRQ